MNDRPDRDEFEELINKINEPDYGAEGPDILAVRRRERQSPAKPDVAAPRTVKPAERAAASEKKPLWKAPAQQPAERKRAPVQQSQPREKQQFVVNISDEEFGNIPDLPADSGASGAGGAGGGQPPKRPSGRNGGKSPNKKQPVSGPLGNRWVRAFVLVFIIVGLAIFLALFALGSANDLLGLNQEDEKIEVTITEEMSTGQIVDELYKTGVIEKKFTFQLYALVKDASDYFKPGEYVMNSNLSYDEIFNMLWGGADQEAAVVRVNFYEGMTAWEIAERLEEKKVCTAEAFIEALNTADFSDYEFMAMIPEDAENRYIRLEGFLFPDTYDFYVDEQPERVAYRFFNNFTEKVVNNNELIARMNDMNMTLYEAMTFASIVQGEAADEDNMAIVSSVFHNRKNNSSTYPRMESDVTRDYVKTDIKPHQDIRDEEMYTAYDTYQSSGLPPGPVGNPGLSAIEATVYPDEAPYYFFVTYIDDEGPHYLYAVTLDEHNVNVYNARKLGEAHGVAVE